jgi:pilus assembly protein Flp/PilA
MDRKDFAASGEEAGPREVNREMGMLGLMKLLRCKRGASAIEYALIGSLIAIAAISGMRSVGDNLEIIFNNVSDNL